MKTNDFDCVVIGAGHAGVEAAHAAAKIGAKTALVTINENKIAAMSCNPAIGGLAKGQIVREVDALGGLMGLATDATGIQFRMLNRSKGAAVQSPRAQADKYKYQQYMISALEQTPNLTIVEQMATDIIVENGRVVGVKGKDGWKCDAKTVIVATGTFLRGLMHIGPESFEGGRRGEPASNELSDCLERLGLTVKRLKTGTPARLEAGTIDYEKLEVQQGDKEPVPFSFMNDRLDRPQIPCWITWTNEKIHKVILDNLDRAPLYTGQIKSTGPRYCPSIETKILRFADKTRHQVFLEPEEQEQKVIYCNGISTSLPKDVQDEMIKNLPGCGKARIVHYGYAIEYDYCPPVQLKNNLETKKIAGLFLAGQINGTSGYEEAAGQGIIAGINAVRFLQDAEPIVLGREQAYIGVMIDDLLIKGIGVEGAGIPDEPYRMFTSRAEFRLSLRSDNADRRLTEIGKSVGLVDSERWKKFEKKNNDIERLKEYLKTNSGDGISFWEQLRRPGNPISQALYEDTYVKNSGFSKDVVEAAIIDAKYEGYLTKQQRLAMGLQTLDKKHIPAELDYRGITHLRPEAKEKLSRFQPQTLGQASRIAGITPADITVILVHLKKYYDK
ncbi:MAG: tRNA uridine-5-carboxymethylaminomethyl(34) synthesis enzyme MnmG [Sedimentisphaerales bacterium]|nr:tRNA uridine-5-carboxymethylaminomethyl(34) synthesis enzyme MnmG [Sedimentisphaerales bacterium]